MDFVRDIDSVNELFRNGNRIVNKIPFVYSASKGMCNEQYLINCIFNLALNIIRSNNIVFYLADNSFNDTNEVRLISIKESIRFLPSHKYKT